MLRRAALLLVFVLVPAASAFESLPGGPHDDITSAAAREAGLPESAIDALVKAVRDVDIRDNKLEPNAEKIDRIDATEDYRPDHHCDRVPPAGDQESFDATVAYIADRSDAAVVASHGGDPDAAVRALGELLHAVQDCISHSNAVDLADPQSMVQAVNGHAAAPEGLRLTGFQPGADDTEMPPGDPYPRGDFAKDSDDKNDESKMEMADGRTKFEAAKELAIEASILALQDVIAELDPEQLEALGYVDAGGQPIPRVGIPAASWALVGVSIVGLAAAMRRR